MINRAERIAYAWAIFKTDMAIARYNIHKTVIDVTYYIENRPYTLQALKDLLIDSTKQLSEWQHKNIH